MVEGKIPTNDDLSSEDSITEIISRNPNLLLRLAENSLFVAESLQRNYFKNTAKFVSELGKYLTIDTIDDNAVFQCYKVDKKEWSEYCNELVSFVDGGVGTIQISSQVPMLIRVGTYTVRTGERNISKREDFHYYPIILGDLEGGSKDRKDYIDVVRIISELLGGLSALQRYQDLHVLLLHGPLMYSTGLFTNHTPFTEQDIDVFLDNYTLDSRLALEIKEQFLREAELDIYPAMTKSCDDWIERKLFEPLSFIGFLYRKMIAMARNRTPKTIIAGVVERGSSTDYLRKVALKKFFRVLREEKRKNWINDTFGRSDLNSVDALLRCLGYNDPLLLSMVLRPGQISDPWEISTKFAGFTSKGVVELPGDRQTCEVNYRPLIRENFRYPSILGTYLQVSEISEPIRIEVFKTLGRDQIFQAANRVYLYSSLLPGYGFPVGLDIADKFAKVPSWMMRAYNKAIQHFLSVSIQRGDIPDKETRRLIAQAIYMKPRDWLFRPKS